MHSIIRFQLLTLVLIFAAFSSSAKDANIRISAPAYKSQKLILAYYYGDKILIADSVALDMSGSGTFNTYQGEGIYVLFKDETDRADLLIDKDADFSIQVKGPLKNKSLQVQNASITSAFLDYQSFLVSQKQKQKKLHEEYRSAISDDAKASIRERMKTLNQGMGKKWDAIQQQYPNTFFADFIGLMRPIKPLDFKLPKSTPKYDSLHWVANYNYTKQHFFDGVNFAQAGILKTPIFNNRLRSYFEKMLIQHPDSVMQPSLDVIEKSKQNDEVYGHVANWFLTHSINSKIMGMDKVFVAIAQSHHLQYGQKLVMDEDQKKIATKVAQVLPNLIGLEAHDLTMQSLEEEYYSLHDIHTKYTILYFYEPGCNHCQVATPKLYKEVYLPLKSKGVEVFAVNIYDKKEEWNDFLVKNNMMDWINVWDPHNTSGFRNYYNVETTPAVYLLDNEKKILAKQIDIESLKSILEQLL